MSSEIRAALLAERDETIQTLLAAAEAVRVVEPAAARDPIRWLLLAAVERCAKARHILGLSINRELALAHAFLDPGGQHART